MTFDEAFAKISSIPGWMGDADCEVLFKHASKTKGLIVEIGSYQGKSASLMALARTQPNLVTIDVREDQTLMGNSGKYGFEVKIGVSWKIGKDWKEGPIDMLFVDGDHSAIGVTKDIDAFLPHLTKHGKILFHDYVVRDEGYEVQQAVDSHGGLKKIALENGIAVCKKK